MYITLNTISGPFFFSVFHVSKHATVFFFFFSYFSHAFLADHTIIHRDKVQLVK